MASTKVAMDVNDLEDDGYKKWMCSRKEAQVYAYMGKDIYTKKRKVANAVECGNLLGAGVTSIAEQTIARIVPMDVGDVGRPRDGILAKGAVQEISMEMSTYDLLVTTMTSSSKTLVAQIVEALLGALVKDNQNTMLSDITNKILQTNGGLLDKEGEVT